MAELFMCTSQWSIDFWYDTVLNTIAVTVPGCTITLFTSRIVPLCSVQQQQCCAQGHHHIWQRMNKTYKWSYLLLIVYLMTLPNQAIGWVMNWKGCREQQLCVHLGHYTGIPGRTKENHKELQNSQSLGPDWNPRPPE